MKEIIELIIFISGISIFNLSIIMWIVAGVNWLYSPKLLHFIIILLIIACVICIISMIMGITLSLEEITK